MIENLLTFHRLFLLNRNKTVNHYKKEEAKRSNSKTKIATNSKEITGLKSICN